MSDIRLALLFQDDGASMPIILGTIKDQDLLVRAITVAIFEADRRAHDHQQPLRALAASAESATLRGLLREANARPMPGLPVARVAECGK
jgi:hypothetical protein